MEMKIFQKTMKCFAVPQFIHANKQTDIHNLENVRLVTSGSRCAPNKRPSLVFICFYFFLSNHSLTNFKYNKNLVVWCWVSFGMPSEFSHLNLALSGCSGLPAEVRVWRPYFSPVAAKCGKPEMKNKTCKQKLICLCHCCCCGNTCFIHRTIWQCMFS